MFGFLKNLPYIFAQAVAENGQGNPLPAEGENPAKPNDPNGMFTFVLLIGGMLVIMWLFMLGPQRKQEKKMREMLNNLKKNDRVYTIGGIVGVVHSVDTEKNEVVLKIDDSNNTKVHFLKSSIAGVLSDSPADTSSK